MSIVPGKRIDCVGIGAFTKYFVLLHSCTQIVTRGSDQTAISSSFEARKDASGKPPSPPLSLACLPLFYCQVCEQSFFPLVIRGYGNLLIELCSIVPDGLACFFVSYEFLETTIAEWEKQVCTVLNCHCVSYSFNSTFTSIISLYECIFLAQSSAFLLKSLYVCISLISFFLLYLPSLLYFSLPFLS